MSDYNHKYWPLAFQIADSENKEAVYEMLNFDVHCVKNVYELEEDEELCVQAQVTHMLVDGGKAIRCAVEKKSNEQSATDGHQIFLRRCFVHVIRMGMTREGGYRGG